MVAQVEKPAQVDKSIASAETRLYSPEEYLEMEVLSEDRHEYRDGEIVLMTGAMPNHNRITRNLCASMTLGLRGQSCEVFVADQRLWIPKKRLHTYPDVMVIDGKLQLQKGRKDTVMNPLLIVEVLSNSTADYDRGDKFTAYRSIPGFQEYLLVSQYGQQIEHYVKRSEKKWDFQSYDETDAVVRLETVGVEMTIADIYDKVEFNSEDGNF
jgi:Uma2 family endonuclease